MRRMLVAALVPLLACDSSGLTGPRALRRLNQAEALWQSHALSDYDYEIRASCFCPPQLTQWVRVQVRNNAVVFVEPLTVGQQVPILTYDWWDTIDEIFARLRTSLEGLSSQGVYASIDVTYDDALGYPREIAYRAKPNVADADASYSIRNLQEALPPPGTAAARP